jgi:DNA-binding transcriptional regulator GbsR (MarR family)
LAQSLVLDNGGAADVVAFERAVVDFFVQAADLLGVPKSVAAIYGLFFATARPLCFAEVEGRLNISKGSVSQGLRVLREVGALKTVAVSDDRREFLIPDLALRKLILRWLDQRMDSQLTAGRRRLTALARIVPGRQADAEVLRSRLDQLKGWHDKATALLPVAKTFLRLTGP